ncbi:TRAP transporter small permease [Jiella sonneratiae]|uniref:TRAP transporter small permease protein n=1 Tax=Jiella sonneratiae TaxID=2816856 RepID=A0ABS3IXG3_9HYPH|nr:TRAP transporter small permease [Jiella sonneratiae]MBO0902102.1 TRAP transporter small permease [Jiella sonneratiae]
MTRDPSPVPGVEPSPPPTDAQDEDISDIRAVDIPVMIVFWALAIVVFLQFFTRYVLNDSLGWTEEIARYLLIGVTFIGAISAVRRESHIAVELLYTRLPRGARLGLQYFVDVVSLAFYATLAWLSVHLAQRTFQKMTSIDVPKSLVYWIVAVCFAAMAIYQLLVLVRHARSGTSRLIDPDSVTSTGPSL